MIDKNSFIPFHHYDFNTIENMVNTDQTELAQFGSDDIGEHFLTLKDEEKAFSFSFVSMDKNDEGIIYMCVSNGQPFSSKEYQIVRTTNDDFLVHVNHQYDHYDANKQFIGKLSYHLYQLTKNTIDNEQIIIAYSTLDALRAFEVNASIPSE
ncbi:MAG: hypothetical protein OCD76_04205 [Reichenbachiella sp.]